MSIRKRLLAVATAGAAVALLGGVISGHRAAPVDAAGPLASGIGCSNSADPTTINFPTSGGIISGIQNGTPAGLSVITFNASVLCGAVFQDTNVAVQTTPVASAFPLADADPNTIDGGTVTFTETGAAGFILESNSTTFSIPCGSTGSPTGTVAETAAGVFATTLTAMGGLESCQGGVPGAATVSPNPANTVHVALRPGATFNFIGAGSPVITLSAQYQRFSSISGATFTPAASCVPPLAAGFTPCPTTIATGPSTLSTNATTIGILTPVYVMTLTPSPAIIPAASGSGVSSTITAALFHVSNICSGLGGFTVNVTGGFLICGVGGVPTTVNSFVAGAESGVVTFTTSSGVFGNTNIAAGSAQQVFSVHCGQVPGTAPVILVPTLGFNPLQVSSFNLAQCVSATAQLFGGGAAGTANIVANFVGDWTGSTAQQATTVSLSPTANTVNLSRGCNEVITPANLAANTPVATVVGTVSPGGIVVSAWQFNNSLHAFQAGFFAQAGAPTDFNTIGPNQSLFLCVSGSGTFPTGAF